MKRYFLNWKFVFIIFALLISGCFYFTQLKNQLKTPSNGWSRGILVKEVSNSVVNNSTRVRIATVPIPDENRFIIFWNDRNRLYYESVDKTGKAGIEKSIGVQLDEPREIKAVLKKEYINLYSIENHALKEYVFDYKNEKLHRIKTLGEKINCFVLQGEDIIAAGEGSVIHFDENGKRSVIAQGNSGTIDALKDTEGNYKITFSTTDEEGVIHVLYAIFNPKTGYKKVSDIGRQLYTRSATGDIASLVIGNADKKMYILAIRKLYTTSVANVMVLYTFDKKDSSQVSVNTFDEFRDFDPNPVRVNSDPSKMTFLASVVSGDDVNIDLYDIRQYSIKNRNIVPEEFLTKTPEISVNPNLFTLDGNRYVQWEDRTGASTKILYASTNIKIIAATERVNSSDAGKVFLDSLMSIGFSLAYMILFFTIIILPTLIFTIIISLFFLNWAERHQRIATLAAVVLQIATQIVLTYNLFVHKPLTMDLMPGFLQISVIRYLSIIIIGAISYWCLWLKYKTNDIKLDKTFITQYAFFSVLNMILFSILIFPYYMQKV